jgi:hypothetical protein
MTPQAPLSVKTLNVLQPAKFSAAHCLSLPH